MRCVRHGRACGEPPPVVHRPATPSRYLVRQLLGKGGFARVYRVAHLPDHESPAASRRAARGEHGALGARAVPTEPLPHYALKVISKCRLGDSAAGREALRKEVAIHRQLEHPAIVKLLAYWEDQYRIFLLMHLIDGPSLEEYVSARGRLSEPEACAYAAHMLQALAYLHANRIVHRDIKLANLLLSPDLSRVVLCDFGLADHLDSIKNNPTTAVCGTPNYVAPELLSASVLSRSQGKNPTKRNPPKFVGHTTSADAWSMGVVLYTMLVGSGPFDSDDVSRTFRRIRAARFTFPLGLKLSPNAKSLIRSLLTENHRNRPSAEQAMRHPFFSSPDIHKALEKAVQIPVEPSENAPNASNIVRENQRSTLYRAGRGERDDRERSNRFDRSRMDRVHARHAELGNGRVRNTGANYRRGESRRWSTSFQASTQSGDVLTSRVQDVSLDVAHQQSDRRERDVDRSQPLDMRPLARAQRERRSSLNSPQVLYQPGFDRRSLNVRSLNAMGGAHCARKLEPGRRSSLRASENHAKILNVSVSLSAALIKGRQFLDDELRGDLHLAKKVRFKTVTKKVDPVNDAPPLVQRWLDYTSKYGFSTMMEDGRTGCCFNDGSIMFYVSEASEVPDLAYVPARDPATEPGSENLKQPSDLSKKACLCSLFAEMMIDGGRGTMYDLPSACNVSFLKPGFGDTSDDIPHSTVADDCKQVHVREWARYRKFRAAAFRLSNNCIHVKFDVGEDHCDDFVFDPAQGTLFYRPAKEEVAYICAMKYMGEFSSLSEYVYSQLQLCCHAISRFLE